jgi:hypothetical protein
MVCVPWGKASTLVHLGNILHTTLVCVPWGKASTMLHSGNTLHTTQQGMS